MMTPAVKLAAEALRRARNAALASEATESEKLFIAAKIAKALAALEAEAGQVPEERETKR